MIIEGPMLLGVLIIVALAIAALAACTSGSP